MTPFVDAADYSSWDRKSIIDTIEHLYYCANVGSFTVIM